MRRDKACESLYHTARFTVSALLGPNEMKLLNSDGQQHGPWRRCWNLVLAGSELDSSSLSAYVSLGKLLKFSVLWVPTQGWD